METTECGAASLAMVLAFHGAHVPLRELRRACHRSREGSKASDLLRTAREYGLIAQGWRAKVEGLAEVALPAVLHWNGNHFVVLEAWEEDRRFVWINDPATGHRRLPVEELEERFSGVVLTFRPGPEFRPRAAPPGILRRSWREFASRPVAVGALAFGAVLLAGPTLAVAICMRIFVDEYFLNAEYHWLLPLLTVMAVAAACQIGVIFALRGILLRWEMAYATQLGASVLSRFACLPSLERIARGPTELATRLALATGSAKLLFRKFGNWLLYLPTAGVTLVWISFFGGGMVLLVTALMGATLWMGHALHLGRRERQAQAGVARSRFAHAVIRGVSLPEAVGWERWREGVEPIREMMVTQGERLALWRLDGRTAGRLLAMLAFVALVTFGAWQTLTQQQTIGSVMAMLALWLPLHRWLLEAYEVDDALGQLALWHDRLDDLPPATGQAILEAAPECFETLEMRGVSFRYSSAGEPVLQGVDLRLQAGSRVGLIGEEGKTTVARLLTGVLVPQEGAVLLNGTPVTPERFGAVAGWSEAATEATGTGSSGERQRGEAERLHASRSRFLLLDHAFDDLSPQEEERLAQTWREQGCGWLWITHRPAVLRLCDEIWFMAEGRIVERGSWETLMEKGGRFARWITP